MSNCYVVDLDDLILSVSDGWLSFARENGASHLTRDRVLRSSLWDFISGAETQHLYGTMFATVRKRGLPIAVPFRCDAPDQRRFMRLTIQPVHGASLELTAALIRAESRRRVEMLDPGARRSDELITMCSWCKRILVNGPGWGEIEEAIEHLALFDGAPLPGITHGVCPDCLVVLERAMSTDSGS